MNLEKLILKYKELGIDKQIDYEKFYLYSIITHSTAIEGSTITETENIVLFDDGLSVKGKSIYEQIMNIDLKMAYEKAIKYANNHTLINVDILKELSSIVMKNTGTEYNTALGEFSSAKGDLRLINVTARVNGKSYLNYSKVPDELNKLCNLINSQRKDFKNKSLEDLYNISFDAHFYLVTIHPWADGNGRMARLIMNMLQFEFGLIPTKIKKEDKEEYIKSLIDTREYEDISIFRNYMQSMMIKNINDEIESYLESINKDAIIVTKRKKIIN